MIWRWVIRREKWTECQGFRQSGGQSLDQLISESLIHPPQARCFFLKWHVRRACLSCVPPTLPPHVPAGVRADMASFSPESSWVLHLCPPRLCAQPNWDWPNSGAVEADRLRHEGNCLFRATLTVVCINSWSIQKKYLFTEEFGKWRKAQRRK